MATVVVVIVVVVGSVAAIVVVVIVVVGTISAVVIVVVVVVSAPAAIVIVVVCRRDTGSVSTIHAKVLCIYRRICKLQPDFCRAVCCRPERR